MEDSAGVVRHNVRDSFGRFVKSPVNSASSVIRSQKFPSLKVVLPKPSSSSGKSSRSSQSNAQEKSRPRAPATATVTSASKHLLVNASPSGDSVCSNVADNFANLELTPALRAFLGLQQRPQPEDPPASGLASVDRPDLSGVPGDLHLVSPPPLSVALQGLQPVPGV